MPFGALEQGKCADLACKLAAIRRDDAGAGAACAHINGTHEAWWRGGVHAVVERTAGSSRISEIMAIGE